MKETGDLKFKCGICGSEYPTVEERSLCEERCIIGSAKRAKNQKSEEIREHYKTLLKEIEDYVSQYGAISLEEGGDTLKVSSKSFQNTIPDWSIIATLLNW